MTARQRTIWAKKIRATAAAWGLVGDQRGNDTQGILPATRLAMQRAVEQLGGLPEHLLIDAVRLPALTCRKLRWCVVTSVRSALQPLRCWQRPTGCFHGRSGSAVPRYGFAPIRAMAPARHQRALAELGPCPQHRFSLPHSAPACWKIESHLSVDRQNGKNATQRQENPAAVYCWEETAICRPWE
jgi:ribonuclease HII